MKRATLTTTEASTITGIPADRRVITPREAQQQLGIPASSIRAWASQKRLFPVSIDRDRSRWYRLADVLALAAGTKRRTRHARPARQRPTVAP